MPKIIADETIFQAVMKTIEAHGYAGATTKQIAQAAGVSEVTLFRKYENKQQLVKRAIAAMVAETDFLEATRYTGDLQADLLRVLQAYQASVVLHGPFFAVLISEAARDPELARSLEQPFILVHAIVQLLARYQSDGVLRQEHPLTGVAALLGPLVYAALMKNARPEMAIPPVDLHAHITFYLEGHSNRSPHPENGTK